MCPGKGKRRRGAVEGENKENHKQLTEQKTFEYLSWRTFKVLSFQSLPRQMLPIWYPLPMCFSMTCSSLRNLFFLHVYHLCPATVSTSDLAALWEGDQGSPSLQEPPDKHGTALQSRKIQDQTHIHYYSTSKRHPVPSVGSSRARSPCPGGWPKVATSTPGHTDTEMVPQGCRMLKPLHSEM